MNPRAEHSLPQPATDAATAPAWRKWLARLGLAGFMFFLLKGMVWLVLMFVVYEGCTA